MQVISLSFAGFNTVKVGQIKDYHWLRICGLQDLEVGEISYDFAAYGISRWVEEVGIRGLWDVKS